MQNIREKIDAANQMACQRMVEADPVLIDVRQALEVVPGMLPNLILHSGPPITWEKMSRPQRNGVIGAVLFEGLAKDPSDAEAAIRSKDILLAPCHSHGVVGSMAGVTSASMQVFVVQNRVHGNRSFHQVYGRGRNMFTFGLYDERVLEDYRWTHNEWASAIASGVRASDGIPLRSIMARALTMGDECHNRSIAGTYHFMLELIPAMSRAGLGAEMLGTCARFAIECFNFFLFLNMAAAKNIADAARNIPYSTIVTALSRNGVEFGVQVSGLEILNIPNGFIHRFRREGGDDIILDRSFQRGTYLGRIMSEKTAKVERQLGASKAVKNLRGQAGFTREACGVCHQLYASPGKP